MPSLGIFPKEFKSIFNRDNLHTHVSTALLTIAKLCCSPFCPTTDEWIKKMCFIYTMEYYSAIKKNEIMVFRRKQSTFFVFWGFFVCFVLFSDRTEV
jgi:hypothetical protein